MGKNARLRGGKGHSSTGYIGDRKLLPRIKEYIKENDGHMLEADEVATALQAEYREYSRKKKAAFRSSVAKALKLVSGETLPAEEGRLQRLERRHLHTRRRREREEVRGGMYVEEEERFEELVSDEDSMADTDFDQETCDDHNMMNNSLLQVYRDNAGNCAITEITENQGSTNMSNSQACSHDDAFKDGIKSAIAPTLNDYTGGNVCNSEGVTVLEIPSCKPSVGGIQHPALVGRTGVPIGIIDTYSAHASGTFLSHATTSDSHVTDSDGHVTAIDGHVMVVDSHVTGSITQSCPTTEHQITGGIVMDMAMCGGVSGVRGVKGKEEERRGRDFEESRRLKKVTFAPDVLDKPSSMTAKGPRKRWHMAGEEESMMSGHKKHRLHHEHRTHHSKHGKQGKSGRVEGERRKVENAIQQTLREKHTKSQFKVEKSSVVFADVGGCQTAIKEVCKLLLHLRHPEVFARLGIRPPQGFLLHGPPGCGKTLLASAIAGEMGLPLIRLAATEVVSGVSGESESTLRELFTLAKGSVPCVLFIDEVDAICPKRETTQREMEKRIVSQLLACVDDLHSSEEGSRVLLIAATTQPDSLDPAIRRSGRFDREICLGIPDEAARLSILQVLTRGLRLENNFPFSDLAHSTPGYVGADLQALIREASLCAVNRLLSQPTSLADNHTPTAAVGGATSEVCSTELVPPTRNSDSRAQSGGTQIQDSHTVHLTSKLVASVPKGEAQVVDSLQLDDMFITAQDFQQALQDVQPSAKREGFATVPDTSWDDVGALEDVREELSLAILAPVRYPRQFSSLGLTTPPGILLAGPPGCGKTLLAKAVANESGINFISVKGPELLNMYVGESERAVRQVFQRARNSAPCVIFFDELDALCPKRSEVAETSASARVVNQLLTEMDGLQTRRHVFIMAATNRPDIIDPAMLRPGRLDKLVYVGLPRTEDRATILNTITKNGTQPRLDSNVDISTLASPSHTAGFSGADLKALVREAAVAALKECMQLQSSHWVTSDQSYCVMSSAARMAERTEVDVSDCLVAMHHFMSALQRVKCSVSEKDRLFYDRLQEQFCKCADKK